MTIFLSLIKRLIYFNFSVQEDSVIETQTTKEEFQICEATLEDLEGVRDLINLVYPQAPWSKDYLKWQYLDNPAGKARVWVAKHHNKIISSYAAVPHHLWFENKITTAWMVQDVLTDPDFRGKGLLHTLSHKCSSEIVTPAYPLNYTFPNQFSHKSFMRNGWEVGFRIPLRVFDPAQTVESLNRDDQKYAFAEISPSSAELDDLSARAQKQFKYSVVRHRDYILWRYAQRPDAKYFFYGVRESGKLISMAILKYFEIAPDNTVAHICDFIVDPAHENVVSLLLKKAIEFAREYSANKLTAWLPLQHGHEKYYDRIGFKLDETLDRWLVVGVSDSNKSADAKDSKNWNLSMGDSDVY